MMILSELNLYPIKSAAGISLTEAEVDARGLKGDRRWMVVDHQGNFLTQRQFPQMALLQVEVHAEQISVVAPGHPRLEIPIPDSAAPRLMVEVWGDRCLAAATDEVTGHWFSQFLGLPCRLVYMPDETIRPVDPTYAIAPHQDQTNFTDGFPFLLISEASLQALNARLTEPLPMNRFRPNLVVRGCEPYAEDDWRQIRIGAVVFHVVKPCSRCLITTVDQATGVRGQEPLRTLAQYRLAKGKIFFGQNLIQASSGTVKLGDPVEVIESSPTRLAFVAYS